MSVPATPIAPEDYVGIQHLLAAYAWSLDTADLATLATLFEPQAVLRDTSGQRYEGRTAILAYFDGLTASPAFRGRQHHIDHLLLTPAHEGYRCRSYWTVTRWQADTGQKALDFVGHAHDWYVRGPQGWMIRERLLYYWRDSDCPWAPAHGPLPTPRQGH